MVETSSQRSGVDLDLDHHHHRAPGTGHRGGFWRLDLGGAFFETKKSGSGWDFAKQTRKTNRDLRFHGGGGFFLVVRGVNVRP